MQQYTCPICSAVGAGTSKTRYKCHKCKDVVYLIESSNGRMIFNAGIWISKEDFTMLNPFTCNDFDWIIGKDVFIKHSLKRVIGVERFMHSEPWVKGENIVLKVEDIT